jgi:hypothetical protein
MKVLIPSAVALLAVLPAITGAHGACRPGTSQRCFAVPAILDLTSVPAISQRIVDREPAEKNAPSHGPTAKPAVGDTGPTARPSLPIPTVGYTGPAIGVSKLGRSPTVGYHWSLD